MGSLKEKAKTLLQQCEVVTLTSINKEGYPRPVPLSKIKTEGLTTIWFATGNSSAKTKDFRSNPKAGICFYKEGNSVAMTGEVEVVSDTGTKKELWQDWFIHHFPKGPEDPEYILLKFRAEEITVCTDKKMKYVLSTDGQELYEFDNEVRIKKAPYPARLALLKGTEFYSILQNKLHWAMPPAYAK